MAQDIHPTNHSLEKMRERHVEWGDIVDIVNNPEVVYGPDSQGRRIMQKGKLSVVVAHNGAIITVLLREGEQWTDEDARTR